MMLKKKNRKNFSVDTLIGTNTAFEGSISSECSVCVEGIVHGKINAKGEVVVGRQGRVEADICAESVVVSGNVIGNINAFGRLEITETGRVTGDIEAATIAIAEGGMVHGACKMIETVKSPYPQLEQGAFQKETDPFDLNFQSDPTENLNQA